jgi:3-methylfumaryl-CoA hydratase
MSSNSQTINLSDWIGRTAVLDEPIDLALAQRIAISLAEGDTAQHLEAGAPLPPLWHWCFFQTPAVAADLSLDGHPHRGGFLPPVSLPRRMWAGGSLHFHKPLPIAATISRESRIRSIEEKEGRSGPLVFVSIDHHYTANETLLLEERQDLVFREQAKKVAEGAESLPPSTALADGGALNNAVASKEIVPSEVTLFRYSALTFNSHRIHYDRDYAKNVEGYAGLVVHGPLLATQLCEFAESLAESLGGEETAQLQSFDFRGQQATLDLGPYFLQAEQVKRSEGLVEIDLRVVNHAGAQSMKAQAVFRLIKA